MEKTLKKIIEKLLIQEPWIANNQKELVENAVRNYLEKLVQSGIRVKM